MIRRLLRDRRGISIAEVVVAMTMVLIITGAAISVQIASTRADVAFRDKYRALTGCENAVECLRFADGNEELLSDALVGAGFTNDNGIFALENGSHRVTVAMEDENYVVKYNGEVIYKGN
jgi:Tfp pilus assembly protein PilW